VYLPSAPVIVVAMASSGRAPAASFAASIRAPAIGPPLTSVTVPDSTRPPSASVIASFRVSPGTSVTVGAAPGS
jgi:hypothetical protein